MGGNLFQLGRLPRAEYLVLEAELRAYLDQRFGELYRIPRYYNTKPDFGDVDIILSDAAIETDWPTLRDGIRADLGIEQWTSNKSVFSTVYRNFQVDFFVRPSRYFVSTYTFLCFNDLGNILGRIFHRMSLKYGEQGLQYVYRRADGNYRRDLDISGDLDRILRFIVLDPSPWHNGFETLEEMYRWVQTSPYFSVAPYTDPGRRTRQRSRQRPTMRRLLEWIEANDIAQVCDYRDSYLPSVMAAFPEANLTAAIAAEDRLADRVAVVRGRFNGQIVQALIPDLHGQRLGGFIRSLRNTEADFEAWVYAHSPEAVQARILSHWSAFSAAE
ncbi:MAG: hypothetical protein AAFV53_20810 [Myxococcota bacterium]